MIHHTQGGAMFTGDAIPYFRMSMQLMALRMKVLHGMNTPGVRGSIVAMVKQEYGLTGSPAKVLAAFEPIVAAKKSLQVHTGEGVRP